MPFNRRDFFKNVTVLVTGGLASGAARADATNRQSSAPTADLQTPPDSPAAAASAATPSFDITAEYDVIVVGGGISGVSAAISAARNGAKVALVHHRAMFGGNSSSEVRLFPEHNDRHQPWIKEGGIHDEFHIEERVRNHEEYREGKMNCHWDLVLYEWVLREKNITIYLNTHMTGAVMDRRNRIRAIQAVQLGTEKNYELSGHIFVDATGDGVLGHHAKADYRWGREGRDEYHEPLAPEQPDEQVMGNTLFFRAVNAGRPVPFKRPDWAAEFPTEQDLTGRWHGHIECGYWWIEIGAPFHPIRDNDKIQHEGLRQLLGVWDHIKNRGDHGAANFGLEFVGFWPYKRESRRIIGDYVVTQQHVQDPQLLPDNVAYGCWGIDIHTQGGILTRDQIPYPPPRTNENWDSRHATVYGIPLRALYSRNIDNLMMAGRPISCSYVAFASSRVLSTGSIVGQAVGASAALCKKYGTTPREIARSHAHECRQILIRQGAHIPGVANEDEKDLARKAIVSAAGDAPMRFPEPNTERKLATPHAQLFPVSADRIDKVELLLANTSNIDIEMRLALRPAPHVWDFRAREDLAEAKAKVPAGHQGWIAFHFNVPVDPEKLYYVYTPKVPGITWKSFQAPVDLPNACPVASTPADLPGTESWRPITYGHALCLRVTPESRPYTAANVIRGTHRPDTWSNIWISDPDKALPTWLELRWPAPVRFNTVELTFDTDANRRVELPLFRYPDCVKDYALQVATTTGWRDLLAEKDNYMRRRVHRFDLVSTDRLRLNVLATNGAPSARVYEVRVYEEA